MKTIRTSWVWGSWKVFLSCRLTRIPPTNKYQGSGPWQARPALGTPPLVFFAKTRVVLGSRAGFSAGFDNLTLRKQHCNPVTSGFTRTNPKTIQYRILRMLVLSLDNVHGVWGCMGVGEGYNIWNRCPRMFSHVFSRYRSGITWNTVWTR